MLDSIVVRLAHLSERTSREALQLRASRCNPGDRAALLANPDAIELPAEQILGGCVFVVELNGAVAGFASLVPRMDGGAELDALFVEPSLWRKGLARTLIRECVSIAEKSGYNAIHVIGNPHAREFYRAVGFKRVGTTATRFGEAVLFCMDVP
jgi:GNAT superfamily N-acetyltransferase